MSKEIDTILEERGANYGSYEVNVKAVAMIMRELQNVYRDKNNEEMNLFDFTNLNYLVIKLVRLGATPNHIDSYVDMQGYAKLAEDMYNEY